MGAVNPRSLDGCVVPVSNAPVSVGAKNLRSTPCRRIVIAVLAILLSGGYLEQAAGADSPVGKAPEAESRAESTATSTADASGKDDSEAAESAAEAKRYRLLPIPIFITESAIGEGLGVALALFHPVKQGKAFDTPVATPESIHEMSDSREAPPVVTALAGAYTSNDTWFAGAEDFQKDNPSGRYIRYGIREHAMGAIMNGIAYDGIFRPSGATFTVFADYLRPSIRLAALAKLPVVYIFTHDSVGVGEDGPTHQPVEHLAALRAIPGLTVIRPADATETAAAWRLAIRTANAPVALILSRQNLPVLDRSLYPSAAMLYKGAYVLSDSKKTPDVILIGTGSEVCLCLEAQALLAKKNVAARVVSMPSWELYEKTSQRYKDSVLPPKVTARVAVEAGIGLGWERYVGSTGAVIGINRFGASAPGSLVIKKYGIKASAIVSKAIKLLNS